MLNKRKRRITVAIMAAFLVVIFVVGFVVLPLFNRTPEGQVIQQKEKPKTAKGVVAPQKLQATNLPLRKPPENVRKREVPPTIAAPTSTQSVVRTLPEGTANLNQQWTKPLAMPVKNPEPPNPSQPPPMKVDPERRPEPDVPRHSVD